MPPTRSSAILCSLILCAAGPLIAQHGYTPADVELGGRLYRANCTACHGPNGDSVPNVDIGRGKFRRATADEQIAAIIRKGIPGTAMPPGKFTEQEAFTIVAYLRSMAASANLTLTAGDPARGKAILEGKGQCLTCHTVQDAGSRSGPDLTDIGSLRSVGELNRALIDPRANMRAANYHYRVVTNDGQLVVGRLLNRDTGSVQLRDPSGRLRAFHFAGLKEHGFVAVAPMPSYRDTLTPAERSDLVSYLTSLKDLRLEGPPTPQNSVSFDRLLHPEREPQNWLTYSGGYHSQRHTALKEITPANVKNLELQWIFQQRSLEKFQATPLVVDGVMYTTQAPSDVVALDAATGRVFWTFSANVSPESRTCCGRVNRGVAILGDTLFVGTVDARLIALDARTGKPIWKVDVAKPESGYSLMHAPLVIKDKVIIGTAGGEYGIRGFIAAYEVTTGKEMWRFYTVPAPGEKNDGTWAGDSWKHGGASVWVTGSYDPDLNLTYWGLGNPGPDWNGDGREGDNLYSDSVVALNPDTGELKWHFQFTPHDNFDFDSVQVPVLADIEWQGKLRKVMMWGNRNGFFYVLDRVSGQYLLGKPFAKVTWTPGLDENGRPIRQPHLEPTPEGTLLYPGNIGATNWYSPSFSPQTGLFYLSVWDDYSSVYVKLRTEYAEGRVYMGGAARNVVPLLMQPPATLTRREEDGYGAVRAIDPATGERKWEFKMADVTDAGVLTTASGLLFSGGRDGNFYALDASTGALLWKARLGGPVTSGPISYSLNGRQYVAVNAGTSMFVFAVKQ